MPFLVLNLAGQVLFFFNSPVKFKLLVKRQVLSNPNCLGKILSMFSLTIVP